MQVILISFILIILIFFCRFDDRLLKNGVVRTNILYGARDINVGNIVFVHGSIDPWHALGLLNAAPGEPYTTIFINGKLNQHM